MGIEIEWSSIFAEVQRITGQPLDEETKELWKNNGKPWALQTIHALAKINEKSTRMPFFCPRKGGSHIVR